MALLTTDEHGEDGAGVTLETAASGGDTAKLDAKTLLRIANGHATLSRTVTIAGTRLCDQGFAHNLAVVVPAVSQIDTPILDPTRFSSTATITYSDSGADITIAPVRITANAGLA